VKRRLRVFARLISCGFASALLLPFLFLGLILAMNPGAAPTPGAIASGWGVLLAAYGLPILLLLPLAFTCIRFFAAHPLQIGWLNLKTTVWFLVTAQSAAISLFAWNLACFGELLGARGRLRLTLSMAAIVAGWLAAAVLAGVAQWKPREGRLRWVGSALLCLIANAPLSLLGLLVPPSTPAAAPAALPEIQGRPGTMVLLALEGASFSEILPLASEGKLPNLAKMLKDGARGPLRTVRPSRSLNAWASLSTGKLPPRHGILDGRVYSLPGLPGELRALPQGLFLRRWLGRHSPAPWSIQSRASIESDLRARPLWSILNQLRVEAVFIDWPLSAPGAPREATGAARETGEEAGEREKLVKSWLARIAGGAALTINEESALANAIAGDLHIHERLQRILWSRGRPRCLAALMPGMGGVAGSFPHPQHPEKLGVVPQGEVIEGHARVLDRYYEMLDQFVGQIRSALSPDDYMLVVSPYGLEPPGSANRLARMVAGLPALAAGHDAAPAGILLLTGKGITPGKQLDDLKITDVVPLTLYFLGLPVGRDMDGRLPRRLFDRAFLDVFPITVIPTYG